MGAAVEGSPASWHRSSRRLRGERDPRYGSRPARERAPCWALFNRLSNCLRSGPFPDFARLQCLIHVFDISCMYYERITHELQWLSVSDVRVFIIGVASSSVLN
jgi:hypothetical protein